MRPAEEKHYKKNRENYESLIARLRQCPAFNRAKTKHYCKINGLDAYYDSVTNALFAPFFEISMNGAEERYDLYYNKERGLIYNKIRYCGYNHSEYTEKEEIFKITFPEKLPYNYVNPVLSWKSTNPFCNPPFYYLGPTGSGGENGASLLPKQRQG